MSASWVLVSVKVAIDKEEETGNIPGRRAEAVPSAPCDFMLSVPQL